MKIVKAVALLIVCCGIPFGLWEGIRALPPNPSKMPNLSYAETVTILLTGVTVVLAALTILVGTLAVLGYEGIKTEARAVATRAVERAVEDAIRKNVDASAIQKSIRREIAQVRKEIRNETATEEALLYSAAFSESTETTNTSGAAGHVGDEYPK